MTQDKKNEEMKEEEVVETTPEKSELDLTNERADEFKNKYLRTHAETTMWKQALTNTVSERVAKNIQNGLYVEKSVVEVVIGNSSGKSVSLDNLQNSSLMIQEVIIDAKFGVYIFRSEF